MAIAFGYGRISTSEDRQIYSPAVQEKQCNAGYEGHAIASKLSWGGFFFDPDISGSTCLCERKAGCALNLRLEKGDYVFIAKSDRAFRSLKDQVTTHEMWLARGVNMILMDIGIDTSTPNGELFLNIRGSVAQWERRIIGQRIVDAIHEKKERGLPTSGCAPIGWKVSGKRSESLFIPFLEERELCAKIYYWKKSGSGWWDISTRLKREDTAILPRHKKGSPTGAKKRKDLWSLKWLIRAYDAHRKDYPCPSALRRQEYLNEVGCG